MRKTVRDMMQVRGMLKDLPAERVPLHVARTIRQELESSPHVPSWSTPFALRLAASLLLTATAAIVIWTALPATQHSPIAANSAAMPTATADKNQLAFERKSDTPSEFALAPAAASPQSPVAVAAPTPSPGLAEAAETAQKSETAKVATKENAALADASPQQALVLASAPQVIIVRASDIPAVQREIDALLGASNTPAVVSYASLDRANATGQMKDAELREDRQPLAAKPAGVVAPSPQPRIAADTGANRGVSASRQATGAMAGIIACPRRWTSPSSLSRARCLRPL